LPFSLHFLGDLGVLAVQFLSFRPKPFESPTMIRWVFLDVGNILLDEDPLTFVNFRVHVEAVQKVRPDLSFESLLQEREQRALKGSAWPLYEVVSQYLDEQGCLDAWHAAEAEIRPNYARLSPPIAGAEALLDAIAPQFPLGLIANQGPECRGWLDQLGWLDRFEVVALSEELGVAKPDSALFRKALDRANAKPAEAIMIGDRLDNDIAPAHALGMKTAWVRWPSRLAKGWTRETGEKVAYLRSLERIAAELAGRPRDFEPAISVDNLQELIPAILAVDHA
jgi:FMN phosphatase YigB (HAD superfamily)